MSTTIRSLIIALAYKALQAVMQYISPMLRELLTTWIGALEKAADSTANKFDDELVRLLKTLLGLS